MWPPQSNKCSRRNDLWVTALMSSVARGRGLLRPKKNGIPKIGSIWPLLTSRSPVFGKLTASSGSQWQKPLRPLSFPALTVRMPWPKSGRKTKGCSKSGKTLSKRILKKASWTKRRSAPSAAEQAMWGPPCVSACRSCAVRSKSGMSPFFPAPVTASVISICPFTQTV